MIRWLGFICIVCGASAVGLKMAVGIRQEKSQCEALRGILNRMRWEIEFGQPPITKLFLRIAAHAPRTLAALFRDLASDMERAPGTPPSEHIRQELARHGEELCDPVGNVLTELFWDLGRQDTHTQLEALSLAIRQVDACMDELVKKDAEQYRLYRTLGVCAGLSLAIILL